MMRGLFLFLAALSGCAPEIEPGRFSCVADINCPDDWSCVQQRCWPTSAGLDAGLLDSGPAADGGGPLDADMDGGPLDADMDGGPVDADLDGGPVDADLDGGPVDSGPPPLTPIADGATVRIDLGPVSHVSWSSLMGRAEITGLVNTVAGDATDVVFSTSGFTGTQEFGSTANAFGWPSQVSSDTFWVGSFDGHEEARGRVARLTVAGLPAGRYQVQVFASRSSNDSGRGRLARYTVGADSMDMDISDNTSAILTFADVSPDLTGEINVAVEVSPAGTARFAYLGAVRVMRIGS